MQCIQDWKIEDLGSNFVPKSLDRSKVDGWFKVSDKDAFSTARRLIRGDGIFCGKKGFELCIVLITYKQ